ncbi:carbohydrate kinase family protein [Actinomadura madurae]|uniref:carbohydrate kinase family protein n=1 Tax=Actinomadura madurae TaxID=1993 RepID=UPI0020D218FB|nr:PfkB family carbohydrate kinase [Actinomadura madurae]
MWSRAAAAEALAPLAAAADRVIASPDELTLLGDGPPDAIAARLLDGGTAEVVVKNGDEARSYTADGAHAVPAHRVDPVDSIGAGDAFAAGYLSGLLDGLDAEAGCAAPTAPARSRCRPAATGRACPTATSSTSSASRKEPRCGDPGLHDVVGQAARGQPRARARAPVSREYVRPGRVCLRATGGAAIRTISDRGSPACGRGWRPWDRDAPVRAPLLTPASSGSRRRWSS